MQNKETQGTQFDQIREWAESKGIYEKGDLKTQTLKLIEESGELCRAVLREDKAKVIDAVGDCTVVLVSVAKLASKHFGDDSITIENCLTSVLDIITKRSGKMENGTFKKSN
jgi:NTP pyrophosphatase (non-canonical NTP hydrolase)